MSTIEASRQADNITPPRRGSVLVITTDATARAYDLSGVAFTKTNRAGSADFVYLTLQCEGSDVYYYFDSATASDLDNTAAVAAGGTPAFATTYGFVLRAGTDKDVRIDRRRDKFLVLKCASGGAGKVRIADSSDPSVGA